MVRRPNVIAVMSPKGGVGKTVTTANLAVALAVEFDKKVLAIDTNVSTASLGLHLDIYYPKRTIHDILDNKFPIKKAIHHYHERMHVIPASIKIKKHEKNLTDIRKNIHKIVKYYNSILKDLYKEYDLILLDCAPGFDIEAIAAMHVAGALLLVTNPEYPSIVTAIKAVEYAKKSKMPVGGIVLNKVRNKKYEIKKSTIEDILKIKVIETIPFDKRIPESIARKVPLVLFKRRSKAGKAYKKLAASLITEKKEKKSKKKRKRKSKIFKKKKK